MSHKNLTIIIALFIFSGCASKPQIDVDTTPTMQVPKEVAKTVNKKGALYSRKGASLFADKKDLQLGDIIQILIEETLTNDSTNSKKLTKSNDSSLGGAVFTGNGPGSLVKNLNSNLGVGFQSSTSNSFNGSATSAADEEFTTTISAIIEQTYQNGNYFIKGTKEMLINGEKQNIKISGVIRPYDISPDNTVYSNQLANLKILYEKDGEESSTLKKSWGTTMIESIWPF